MGLHSKHFFSCKCIEDWTRDLRLKPHTFWLFATACISCYLKIDAKLLSPCQNRLVQCQAFPAITWNQAHEMIMPIGLGKVHMVVGLYVSSAGEPAQIGLGVCSTVLRFQSGPFAPTRDLGRWSVVDDDWDETDPLENFTRTRALSEHLDFTAPLLPRVAMLCSASASLKQASQAETRQVA